MLFLVSRRKRQDLLLRSPRFDISPRYPLMVRPSISNPFPFSYNFLSLISRYSECADNRILLVVIYILISIERIRFRHGRRNSRQDDSIALFTLEHRGQFQLHLSQEAEKGSSQRLSLPDLGGDINWPFKNDVTVQGRRQRYI